MYKSRLPRWKKFLLWFGLVILIIWLVTLNAGTSKHIDYGFTFSEPYAKSLGIDWKQAYTSSLDDLHPQYVRLSAYWDEVEKDKNKYTFDDLDFQVQEANKRNVKVILAVGRRLPRWPECHDPGWISSLPVAEEQSAQLSYVETVVERYSSANISMWQVENEPFLSTFGICPPLNLNFYDQEIALVKKLDPTKPVLITDSGELDWWFSASARGDVFGTTFYRYVFSDVLKRYWTNFYFMPWVYQFKAGIIRMLHPGKPVMVSELEAEPWTTAGIPNTPIDQQMKTMSLDHFQTITRLSAQTGFSPQILWGVEWWYWMKQHGHPEFWQSAKLLINHHN